MTQDEKWAIYTVRPDGARLTHLDPGPASSYHPLWSPDGRRIAYLSGDSRETARLTILDYENGQIQRVDFPGVTTFTWSPDGQKLAFTTEPGTEGGGDYYVYLVSLADVELVSLYKMPNTKRIVSLDWSPKGDKILAMWQNGRNPVMYLRLFSLSGEYATVNTRKVLVYGSSWDPTGEWIAFTGDKLPEWTGELWVISAEGTQARRILQNQDVFGISWSPDGKHLVYSNGCCGHPSGISVIDLETQAVFPIAPPEASAYVPSWSPDGGYLAFLTASEDIATKGYSLNIYSFATGKVTQIIGEMVDGGPSWRP